MRNRATAWVAFATAVLLPVGGAQAADGADIVASPDAPEVNAPSDAVTIVTDWVVASGDHGGRPFMVIDKAAAEVFVFDGLGQFVGRTPALLGAAKGDDSTPGIGDRELSRIPPEDRTTPAGRFVAGFGFGKGRSKVLWVDYSTAVSLHPVVTGSRKERRLERLKSPSPEDNRITYGCINVPAAFFKAVVKPLLENTSGIVYILPESRSLSEVFWAGRPQG